MTSRPLISDDAWICIGERLKLSSREVEIAKGVLRDEKESAIGRELGISAHTVHTHLERLYRKLQVCSRLELAMRLALHQNEFIAEPHSALLPICGTRSAGECPLRS